MWHLQQHTSAVAGVYFGAAGTAMIKVLQDFDALLQNAVRLASLHVHNEANAAGIVFELWIVKPLFFRSGGNEIRSRNGFRNGLRNGNNLVLRQGGRRRRYR